MWFAENAWPPILVCALGSVTCLGMWNNDRRNRNLVLALTFLGMMGAFYVVERMIVTDGERLQGSVRELCNQFRNRDQKALDHFSENAPELKELCKSAMELVKIHDDLRLSNFDVNFLNERSRAKVHFRANATISTSDMSAFHPFRCVLTFRKEGGLWKIVDVERLDPIKGDKMAVMEHR